MLLWIKADFTVSLTGLIRKSHVRPREVYQSSWFKIVL